MRITGSDWTSRPVILVAGGRADRCVTGEIHRDRFRIPLKNFSHAGDCPERVAVFSRTHAAALALPVWSDGRDVVHVALGPRVRVPVHVWVLYDPCSEIECTAGESDWFRKRPVRDLEALDRFYASVRSGISFAAAGVHDVTGHPAAARARDERCEEGAEARREAGHVAGALNVYYVRRIGVFGAWCAPDTVLISDRAQAQTLAHEVGHALSLGHAEHVPGVGEDNLMKSVGAMNWLTLGQLFRASFDARSIVNRFGWRRGPTVLCIEADARVCPPLELDYRPPRY